jgi:ComF family protein
MPCLAAVAYRWPWADCVTQFKFAGQPGWAGALATVMRSTPWVEPALEQADRVLPMPLARERLAERGFNQALLLAQHLAPRRTDARLLLRTRHTPAQSELKRAERLRNVQGVFAVEPLRAHELRDRRVVLVDDVMTSGASLHAASLALRQAGAAHITALVFARTEVGLAPSRAKACAAAGTCEPGSPATIHACSTSSWSSLKSRPTPAT